MWEESDFSTKTDLTSVKKLSSTSRVRKGVGVQPNGVVRERGSRTASRRSREVRSATTKEGDDHGAQSSPENLEIGNPNS